MSSLLTALLRSVYWKRITTKRLPGGFVLPGPFSFLSGERLPIFQLRPHAAHEGKVLGIGLIVCFSISLARRRLLAP
jgi:hypothetical protein